MPTYLKLSSICLASVSKLSCGKQLINGLSDYKIWRLQYRSTWNVRINKLHADLSVVRDDRVL